MNKQAYNGAYSRRRFSNYTGDPTDADKPDFHIETSDPIALKKATLKVSWNGAMGRVTGSGNYTVETATPACEGSATVIAGTTVTLTAEPDAGYHFVGWRGAPVEGVTSQSVNIRVSNNLNVSAVFAPDTPGEHHDLGGDHDHDAEKPNGYQYKPQGGSTGVLAFLGVNTMQGESNLRAFVRKYWWAILIVAYIAYKEWKGGKQ